jgi:hypothetical protein
VALNPRKYNKGDKSQRKCGFAAFTKIDQLPGVVRRRYRGGASSRFGKASQELLWQEEDSLRDLPNVRSLSVKEYARSRPAKERVVST